MARSRSPAGVSGGGRVEQAEHVVDREVVGQPAIGVRRAHAGAWRRRRARARCAEMAGQALDRRELARRRAAPVGAQPVDEEGAHGVAIERRGTGTAAASQPARAARNSSSWRRSVGVAAQVCGDALSSTARTRSKLLDRRLQFRHVRQGLGPARFRHSGRLWYQPLPGGAIEADVSGTCHHWAGRQRSAPVERVGRRDACLGCGADLHCCRNCRFHDPAAHNQCREPQAERQVDKAARQLLRLLQPRAAPRPRRAASGARAALDALFAGRRGHDAPRPAPRTARPSSFSAAARRAIHRAGRPSTFSISTTCTSISRPPSSTPSAWRGKGRGRAAAGRRPADRRVDAPAARQLPLAEQRDEGEDRVAFVFDATVRFDDGGTSTCAGWSTPGAKPTAPGRSPTIRSSSDGRRSGDERSVRVHADGSAAARRAVRRVRRVHFPAAPDCPYCSAEGCDERELSERGTLCLFTMVVNRPPGYGGEVPFGFGVVELPEGLR